MLANFAEQFAALAAEIQPPVMDAAAFDDDALGPLPDYLKRLGLDLTNAALMPPRVKPKPADVLAAALAIPAAEYRDRNRWRDLIGPLATVAAEYPDLEPAMRSIMHEASSRDGAFTANTFPHGYDADTNDAEFGKLRAETTRRTAKGEAVRGLGSLYMEARQHGWLGPEPEVVDEARHPETEPCPPHDLASLDISCGLDHREKRRPIHGFDLFGGYVTNVSGPGGSLKSSWASGVALAVATGRELLGEKVPNRGNALFINAEDRRGEVMLRFQAAMMLHGITPEEVAGRIKVLGAENLGGLRFTRINERTRREEIDPAGFALLRSWVGASAALLVVLDPLVALMPYGANDGGIAGGVMRELNSIANEFGCAIMVVQHTRKGGTADTEGAASAAGSVANINLARVALGFVNVTDEEGRKIGIPPGQAKRLRAIVNMKANLAPLMERRFVEVMAQPMGNGTPEHPEQDWVGVVAPYTPREPFDAYPDILLHAVLGCIAAGAPSGAAFSPAPGVKGDRSFVRAVSAVVGQHMPDVAPQHRDSFAKGVVGELIQRGWIEVADVRVPKATGGGSTNASKGLVVKWSATPWAANPLPGPHTA